MSLVYSLLLLYNVLMSSYYNEFDPSCCDLLQKRIDSGNLPPGFIDRRSIEEVQVDDLKGYNEAHFFAGIGGFAAGFARAGIPADVTVWTGGFPCQDLSVAGKRKGLAGARSGLYFEFHRLITEFYPELVVLENVPGLLSSNEGRDFALVIGGLTGIVPEVPKEGWGNAGFFRGIYTVAYRVLDAQFFGVAQRRRRVFVVGSLGSGRAAEVLFERESGSWDTPPSRETGQEFAAVAGTLSANRGGTERPAGNANELDFCIPVSYSIKTAQTGSNGWGVNEEVMNTLDGANGFAVTTVMAHGQAGAETVKDYSPSLTLNHEAPIVFQQNTRDEVRLMNGDGQIAGALAAESGMKQQNYIAFNADRDGASSFDDLAPKNRSLPQTHYAPTLNQAGQMMAGVRRLTPLECERLQGFPRDWTAGFADSVRYRMLGNAVAVPVVEWIARRIRASA
jgi:DNA (cytosine-5)-methyltransferase 1